MKTHIGRDIECDLLNGIALQETVSVITILSLNTVSLGSSRMQIESMKVHETTNDYAKAKEIISAKIGQKTD